MFFLCLAATTLVSSAIGETAANIAHEIKNSLAAIQLQAQILRRYEEKFFQGSSSS